MPTVTALAILLGFGALVVLLGLLVRLVARAAAPRVPRGPATPELIDTPPAVVNLLMNGLRAAPEAAAATLLHLAARRHLELDQPGADPAATIVRVRSTGRADLTASEQRVLDRVEAPPGVHPLTLGDLARRQAEDGQGWQERLLVAARADAAARGLIQPGRSSPAFAILVAGLMLVLVLSCVAGVSVIELAGLTDRLGSNGYAIVLLGIAVLLTLAAIFAAVGIAGDIRDERLTAEGRRVAQHWDGVARWLRAHESFAGLPPASVTVWDSYLAYGVALGAAPGAAAIVDLRVGQVDVIRSPLGGGRIVRVRYPRTGGLKSAGAGLRIVCAVSGIALAAALATRELPGWAAIAVAALAGLLSLRWAYRIVRGLADLLRPARISGQVLRIVPFGTVGDAESTNRLTLLYESPPLSWLTRRTGAPVVTSDGTGLVPGFFVVLDDGTAPVLQAWRASPRRAGMLRPGDVVDARVQPWTKRLISAAPLPR